MLKIFYLLNLLVYIISEEINQWKFIETPVFTSKGVNSTSLTSISSPFISYYLFTYNYGKGEFIYSTEQKEEWGIINATLSPSSINLDNNSYIIFAENGNKFFYYNRKDKKFSRNEIEDEDNIIRLKGFKSISFNNSFFIALIGTTKIYKYQYNTSSIKLIH
jgi:hypothetical protein